MDILNFISWIRGGRVVNTVDPAKTLLPVGLKDNRRDDAYLAGAISVEDLVTQITPTPTYKVYTALLSQSGSDEPINVYIGTDYGATLVIGVTYTIRGNDTTDFTNVGAPNNNVDTVFVATGENPANQNSNGQTYVQYVIGAPTVKVLENTIGNVYWTYLNEGQYMGNLDVSLTTEGKQFILAPTNAISASMAGAEFFVAFQNNAVDGEVYLTVSKGVSYINNSLVDFPIEIRVYN